MADQNFDMPPVPEPAIDLLVLDYGVHLKISDSVLAVGFGLASIGLLGVAVLYKKFPHIVEGAIKGALEAAGVKIVKIATGSIIVEVRCTTRESFLAFMKDFEMKKVKEQLEKEFQKKLDYKGELEVIITNEKEVYKELNQLRQLVAKEEEGVMSVRTEVGGSPVKGASISGQCASKRTAAEAFEDTSTSRGASSTVPSPPKRKASEAFESSLSEGASSTVPSPPKRKASEAFGSSLSKGASISGQCASKRTAAEAFEDTSTSRGASSTVPSPPKRKASEAFESSLSEGASSTVPSPPKRKASEAFGSSLSEDEEFDADVIFALDSSSAVSDKEFQMELDFANQMAASFSIPLNAIAYGDNAVSFHPGDTRPQFGEGRRMDLALIQAAESFNPSSGQKKLIVLISAGRQASGSENKQHNVDLLVSAYKKLTSSDIKVVIVPVTSHEEPNFRELGLLVKRPQSLYPLDSFDGFTCDTAKKIAFNIKKTFDVEAYTKERFRKFSEIPQDADLWENMSLCSDVLEGAWYILYDDKKDTRPRKVKKAIRESVDSLQSTLVTESKISLLLAVFGNQGKGKSFILNYLLNWNLPVDCKEENAPLPSAFGESQTPLPIYIKYGNYVEVVLRDEKSDSSPVVWFPEEELRNGTLRRVKILLETKFQDAKILPKSSSLELKGPFSVFKYLKQSTVTTSGHLELDVGVEFMDLPGSGSKIGDASISDHLSKADVVLFFNSNEGGRPVSSECITQVFRSHKEFEYTSRPKLVHIVNDKITSSIACDFDSLQNEKRNKDLREAWDGLFNIDVDDGEIQRYKDVRSKLPKRDGEDLLEKMKEESDLLYFHVANADFLPSLKKVVSDHVQSVILKQKIHPVLQGVHWAAKKLKERTKDALYAEKRRSKSAPADVTTSFKIELGQDKVSNIVASFMNQTDLELQSDFEKMLSSLYENFLYCDTTSVFLLDLVRESLDIFADNLIYDFTTANFDKLGNIPPDITNLGEMVCKNRTLDYCSHTAPGYMRQVLDTKRTLNLFGDDDKTHWSSASMEEREDLCEDFLFRLLDGTVKSLEKGGRREKERKNSCFEFSMELKKVVTELLAFRSISGYIRTDTLQSLQTKLAKVVKFCFTSFREINPHPSLNVKATTSLPDKMVNVHAGNEKPLVCSHEKIVGEMTELLRNPLGKGKRRSKEADVIRQLETKLKIYHGQLKLRELQNVDRRFWEWSLLNVLADKYHFDLNLASDFPLNRQDAAKGKKLLRLARERLFAYEKSCVTCKIVNVQSLQPFAPTGGNTGGDNEDGDDDNDHEYSPDENEIHLQNSRQEKYSLEALVCPQMSAKLDAIRDKFKDPSHHLAPIFIPVVRPGPTTAMQGNYFLDEDRDEEEDEKEENEKSSHNTRLNIFLVVEPRHVKTIRTTIRRHRHPQASNVNLIVLPQSQRGIGVSRAIIKIVAECLNFSLYWTIDDDIQFMFEFDTNDRRWHKCSFTRGLLFGQRVFQTCLAETVKELSVSEKFKLFSEVTSNWPDFAKETKANVAHFLMDSTALAEIQKNPSLLHQPFKSIPADSGGDPLKVQQLKALEMEVVDKCRKGLFEDSINYIAGVSIAHEKTKKSDFTGKYPAMDYMRSEQRSQVVLNNAYALKGRNFVTDDVIFHDEFQASDKDKLKSPYWGITGSEKSFTGALTVGGVASYQVIRIIYAQRKSRRPLEEDYDED